MLHILVSISSSVASGDDNIERRNILWCEEYIRENRIFMAFLYKLNNDSHNHGCPSMVFNLFHSTGNSVFVVTPSLDRLQTKVKEHHLPFSVGVWRFYITVLHHPDGLPSLQLRSPFTPQITSKNKTITKHLI